MSLLPVFSGLLLPGTLKTLVSTLRVTIAGPHSATDLPDGRGIFAFWHGKMIYGWLLAQKLYPEREIHAVVSLSRDGEILSRTLENLGFVMIRGSSSRGSGEVKSAMLEELANKNIIAITPDGPRGPCHSFKYGTLALASEQGIPVIFADIRYSKTIRLRSWDRFEIPLPFSTVNVTLHRIEVPELATREDIKAYERQLSKHLTDG